MKIARLNGFLEKIIITMAIIFSVEGSLFSEKVYITYCDIDINLDDQARRVFWGEFILACEKNTSFDESLSIAQQAYNEIQYKRLVYLGLYDQTRYIGGINPQFVAKRLNLEQSK